MQSQPLRAWELGLNTSHGIACLKSQVWHGWLHGNTFWSWGLGLVLRIGSSKKLYPILKGYLHHGPWSCPISHGLFHGHTSMVKFMRNTCFRFFGLLTKCKPSVNQEKRQCIKKWMCLFCIICSKMVVSRICFSGFIFSPTSSLLSYNYVWKE